MALQISKTIKRTRTLNGAKVNAGDVALVNFDLTSFTVRLADNTTDSTYTNISVNRQELIWTKKLIFYETPVTNANNKDPTNKVYDYKQIVTKFRLTGFINESSLARSENVRDYLRLMFEDGNKFTFKYHSDSSYSENINVSDAIFFTDRPADGTTRKINFIIDYVKVTKDRDG